MKKLLITTVIALVAIFVVAPRFVRWTAKNAKAPGAVAALRLAILQRTLVDSNTVADSNDVVAVVMDWSMGPRHCYTRRVRGWQDEPLCHSRHGPHVAEP